MKPSLHTKQVAAALSVLLFSCFFALTHTSAQPAKTRKRTALEVIELWSPRLKTTTDYQWMGGSPKESPHVAAHSFRAVGSSYGELWTHYAKLCGIKEQYAEKSFLNTAGTGPNGSYVVSDRVSGEIAAKASGRGLSVFLLKTDDYTVSVTFQPSMDGKSIIGSLTATSAP